MRLGSMHFADGHPMGNAAQRMIRRSLAGALSFTSSGRTVKESSAPLLYPPACQWPPTDLVTNGSIEQSLSPDAIADVRKVDDSRPGHEDERG